MKSFTKILFILVVSFLLLSVFSFVGADISSDSEKVIVNANILGFGDFVEIEISPDVISFGNITPEDPVSSEIKINFNSTGNTDITITPELTNSSEEIFSYLYFKRILSEDLTIIGNYSLNISKPSSPGSIKTGYCYAVLDLTDFEGEVYGNLINHTAEVTFWALESE